MLRKSLAVLALSGLAFPAAGEGLELHAGATIYRHYLSAGSVAGTDVPSGSRSGYNADLELALSLCERHALHLRVHAGNGRGADALFPEGAQPYANLNTMADDNPAGKQAELLEAYYSFAVADGRFRVTVGKTEPPLFIDENAYANDENEQFVDKTLVNNPILDGEFQFAPLVAVEATSEKGLKLSFLLQSNEATDLEWNGREWTVREKSVYSKPFEKPLFAFEVSWLGERGNYRFYYWNDTADHLETAERADNQGVKPQTGTGWGVGLSADWHAEGKGFFLRASRANEDVYDTEWFFSGGVVLEQPLKLRRKNSIGVGASALVPSDGAAVEWHMETYYRIELRENVLLIPNLQVVLNPQGNGDPVLAGGVRLRVSF
jgi:hypothetical protein